MPAPDISPGRIALPRPLCLFPLRTVLFPGGLLPLKVFEARYLDLMSHCLRSGDPFGVVCLKSGAEVGPSAGRVALEEVGVLARVDELDAEQAGILRVNCSGLGRFRRQGAARQRDNELWVCDAVAVPDDASRVPAATMFDTVQALQRAIASLRAQGALPFAEPFRLDDAGWVANRWCELLPISLAAKQKLMELEDPVIRLSLVDAYLRDKRVVV
jgi:uncharacterized protein